VPSDRGAAASTAPPLFRNIAPGAGLHFPLGHGGRSPLDILETLGHGAALLDVDGDGRLDVLLLGPDRCALFRAVPPDGDAGPRFEEITARSGLRQQGYWMGCAAADYDGDGRTDLLVTGYRTLALYRNEGGRFRDVTAAAGVTDTGWSTSAGFADFDGDGWLDLYVARYVRYLPGMVRFCDHAGVKTACGPTTYDAERGRLFRNLGPGSAPDAGCRFADVTEATGLAAAQGNALGVAWGDPDDDGRPDLAVANDQLPGDLFRNRGGGRFESAGLTSGIAYNAAGQAYAGMGIDWGDVDGDGRPDLVVTTYQHQPRCLYRQDRPGLFIDAAAALGIAHATVNTLGFGVRFLDWDNDGWLDLAFANGHVVDNIQQVEADVTYRQPVQLFRNRGAEAPGVFEEVSDRAGPDVARPIVGRGLCAADLDGDGRLDLLVVDAEGEPRLLQYAAPGGHWLEVRLAAPPPNRDALGARVRVTAAGRTQTRHLFTDGSYMSAGAPRLHFGLGAAERVEQIEVRWPGGRVEAWRDLPADRAVLLRRGHAVAGEARP
jgi:hypothetical protein